MPTELELKQQKVKLYEEKLRLKKGLPHLYGFKMYPWQKEYFEDYNYDHYFICAANQIGKSSIQIRKRIDIATRPELWPEIWPQVFSVNPNTIPMSWYLYPNQTTVMDEYKEKWIKTLLPSGEFKDHPVYGWTADIRNKILHSITFNTGYTIYFKTYNQNVHDLQAGTAFAVDLDEEAPISVIPELQARLFGTNGPMSMAFTATKGQEEWRRAIEEIGTDMELYPDAWKRRISVYDCLKYADGSATPWNETRINKNIRACTSEAEVQRRIFGHFVKDSGLKYPQFNRKKHIVNYPKKLGKSEFKGVPKGWDIYSGVDYGSGGDKNHPSAIVFASVNPQKTKIRVFKAKRFDKIEMTQADLYSEYVKMRGGMRPVSQVYDWAAKDFGTIASRAGDFFKKAEKSHEIGENALASALKSDALKLYNSEDVQKLAREFEGLSNTIDKRKAKDDLIDALRYTITSMPINWAKLLDIDNTIAENTENSRNKVSSIDKKFMEARPQSYMAMGVVSETAGEDFEFWNELY